MIIIYIGFEFEYLHNNKLLVKRAVKRERERVINKYIN